MADACAKCGAPLPKADHGPPRRLCAGCRTATLMGVAADEIAKLPARAKSVEAASRASQPARKPAPPTVASSPLTDRNEGDSEQGSAVEEESGERSSVMADLRNIAQATSTQAPRGVDEELVRMPSGYYQPD